MPKLTQMIWSKTRIVLLVWKFLLLARCEQLSEREGVYRPLQRWNSVSVGRPVKVVTCSHDRKPIKTVCLSLLRTLTTIGISFTIDRGINDIYLQEMWYFSSNIHRWYLSTVTAGTPGPAEQSQSYRQSLCPDFYVKKFWRLICAFFISVSFHRDVEFIWTCISYLQISTVPQNRDLLDTNYLTR